MGICDTTIPIAETPRKGGGKLTPKKRPNTIIGTMTIPEDTQIQTWEKNCADLLESARNIDAANTDQHSLQNVKKYLNRPLANSDLSPSSPKFAPFRKVTRPDGSPPIPLVKTRKRSNTAEEILSHIPEHIQEKNKSKVSHKILNFGKYYKKLPKTAGDLFGVSAGTVDNTYLEKLEKEEAALQKRIDELREKERELLKNRAAASGKSSASSMLSRKKKEIRKVNTREISICERLGSGFSGAVVYSCIVDGIISVATSTAKISSDFLFF